MASRSSRTRARRAADGPTPAERKADRLLAAGRLTEARAVFEGALRENPKSIDALRGLARVKLAQRNPVGAEELYRKLIRARPTDARARGELGLTLHQLGQAEAARNEYERAVALDKTYTRAWLGLADVHERLHNLEGASRALERATQLDAQSPETRLRLARVKLRAGERDGARALFSELAQDNGESPAAAQALCDLGRLADQDGNFDEAAHLLSRGKEMMLAQTRVRSIDQHVMPREPRELFDRVSQEMLARWAHQRDEIFAQTDAASFPAALVFLMGFPRSGTTLTEQVLAAHPEIESTDETPMVEQTVAAMETRLPADLSRAAKLDMLTPAQIGKLRNAYSRAASDRAGSPVAGRVLVDKMPLNTLALPAICRFFPEAKVLFALRDPRDVAVSCYLRLGGPEPGATPYLSWSSIARFYDFVMSRYLGFRDRCPLPILEQRYEDIVDDLPSHAHRLTEWLGLDWDDGMLRFHERARFVGSPTYADVAKPVHRGAIGRWRGYERHMREALDVLTPYVARFEYETHDTR